MVNDLMLYRKFIKERGYKELDYQKDIVTNPKYNSKSKPVVVAMGTSAGKTLTTILKLEVFYSHKINKNKKTIIFPSTTVVLRDNFETELQKFKPNFKFKIITNQNTLKNKKILDTTNVFVMLPQTGVKMLKLIPKCSILILDEAHQWYFQSTIKKLIKHINPEFQYLLTGSPSIFNSSPSKFIFKYVSVMEFY
jgi:superfamily II DNA or RNA helicase